MPTNRDFNLLDQANHYLKIANFAYNKIDLNTMEEDFYIRDCCLFLQMTLELYVKGLVEHLCGVEYNHTHYFANNINIIKSNRENINNFDKLENILDRLDDREEVIVKWHTNAVNVIFYTTL